MSDRRPMVDGGRPRIRVLGVGLYARGSFYRVLRSLLEPLARRFDVHSLGIGYDGPRRREGGIEFHPGPRGLHGYLDDLDRLLSELRPDLLLLVHEIRMAASLARHFGGRPGRPAVVAYSPIEGRILRSEIVAPLSLLDRMVVYTESARREIERCCRVSGAACPPPALDVIPCGVDLDTFHPLGGFDSPQRRRRARERAFPGRPGLEEAFIVLNASQCVFRKRLDITLWGFADFVRDKPPDVYLYLHRAGPGCGGWEEIERLATALGIRHRLILPTRAAVDGDLTSADLNLIYNACDVGVNTSMAEGWGLASFEHAATGAAQIVPGHSSPNELWRGAARLLPPRFPYRYEGTFEMDVVPSSALAATLEELYRDRAFLAALSRSSYERATQHPAWTWSAVSAQFERLFAELASERGGSRGRDRAKRAGAPSC